MDPTKNVTYNVTVNSFSAPTLNSSSVTLKSVPRNEGSSNLSATVTVTSPVGGYEVSSGTNSSIASYSMSGNNCTVKAVKAGSTSITFRNKLDNSKTKTYSRLRVSYMKDRRYGSITDIILLLPMLPRIHNGTAA